MNFASSKLPLVLTLLPNLDDSSNVESFRCWDLFFRTSYSFSVALSWLVKMFELFSPALYAHADFNEQPAMSARRVNSR